MSDGIVDKDFGNLQNLFRFGIRELRLIGIPNHAVLGYPDNPDRQEQLRLDTREAVVYIPRDTV